MARPFYLVVLQWHTHLHLYIFCSIGTVDGALNCLCSCCNAGSLGPLPVFPTLTRSSVGQLPRHRKPCGGHDSRVWAPVGACR
eukprot:226709-Chlamydomonas_euryale.AAC.5